MCVEKIAEMEFFRKNRRDAGGWGKTVKKLTAGSIKSYTDRQVILTLWKS